MNKNLGFSSEISFDQGAYKLLYYHYRPYIVPLLILFVCTILFLKIIIPQFKEVLGAADEIKILQEDLAVSKGNLALLSAIADSDLNNKLSTVSKAIPPEKDFVGILNAVSLSAAKSGVILNDFSFQVGELSSTSAKLSKQPSLQVSLSILGGVLESQRFLEEMAKNLPLSEVTKVSVSDKLTTITVLFYYRPFPVISYDKKTVLKDLSRQDVELLTKLSSWSKAPLETPVFFQVSSGSARTSPFE